MNQIREAPFGAFSAITLQLDALNTFTVVPQHGATLIDLKLDGVEVIDGYGNATDLIENKWAKSAFLFPFPNRLRDGIFNWEGQQYQFPIKESAGNNAIHGLSRAIGFEVIHQHQNETAVGVDLICRYRKSEAYFPFDFDFIVSYQLSSKGLTVTMSVQNRGESTMPFGFGWHPYFKLGPEVEKYALKLPNCELVEVDTRMLPTGMKKQYRHFEDLRILGKTRLDTCFYLPERQKEATIILVGSHGALAYTQQNEPGQFPFFQVFTPDHQQSVALEPMTCNVDAFNNLEGLHVLQPDQVLRLSCNIQFAASK